MIWAIPVLYREEYPESRSEQRTHRILRWGKCARLPPGGGRFGEVSAKRQLLILLDLNLPDMSGIDILTKIKGNTHLRRSPVVILTTTDDLREIQRCYDLGANVYITKPVDYDGFANAIRQLGLFFSVIQVAQNA